MAHDPEPKPLRDLLLGTQRFCVPPLQWTSRHLDLVGCRFEDVALLPVNTESTQNNDTSNGQERSSKKPNDAEVLATNIFADTKRKRLINILAGEEGRFKRPRKGPPFYFSGRPVHQPEYITFRPREQSVDHSHHSSGPLVGYVHYTDVVGSRREQFEPRRPGPGGLFNYIGARICRKREAQLTPEEWTEDPYFLCHLLAIAQLEEDDPLVPATYTSRIIVTHVDEREYILFYEADITTELMDALWDPKNATKPVTWPTIRRKKLPYKPYDTFADRLTAELMAPCPSSHGNPVPSDTPVTPPDHVIPVIENGQKRPCEQEDSGSNKIRLISEERSGCFNSDQGAGDLSAC